MSKEMSYKEALKVIKEHEKNEDKKFIQRDIKNLKQFEGRCYHPTWWRPETFEKVIKVDNKGNLLSEIIEIDISVNKYTSVFARNSFHSELYTKIAGTRVDARKNQISDIQYNKIKTLAKKLKSDISEILK